MNFDPIVNVLQSQGIGALVAAVGRALTRAQEREAAGSDALRSLLLEVDHNLALLSKYRVDEETSVHAEWVTLGANLKTEAHRDLLFAMREFERAPLVAEEARARREARRLELQRVLHTPVVFLAPDGSELETWLATDEEVAAQIAKLERRREVGMLRAIAFVVSRVEAFRTFENLATRTSSITKNVRGGVRLRTLMVYENSIRSALRGACPELHDAEPA